MSIKARLPVSLKSRPAIVHGTRIADKFFESLDQVLVERSIFSDGVHYLQGESNGFARMELGSEQGLHDRLLHLVPGRDRPFFRRFFMMFLDLYRRSMGSLAIHCFSDQYQGDCRSSPISVRVVACMNYSRRKAELKQLLEFIGGDAISTLNRVRSQNDTRTVGC